MSTDLYGIRVLEVEPEARRMRLRVFVVYYDTTYKYYQPIPEDRSFFVRVLCDKKALGDDISQDDQFDESYINRNAFRYIDRFVELERRNSPLDDYEGYFDFYYCRNGSWQDEDKLVGADYDVFVAKQEYLDPFSVGDSWGSTSYPTESDDLTPEDYMKIPDFGDDYSLVPFPDKERLASVADQVVFSQDGSKLLVGNAAGGFRIFSTKDWSVLGEELDLENKPDVQGVGWTRDGQVAMRVGVSWVAVNLETGEKTPFSPFGYCSNPAGTRFINDPTEKTLEIYNDSGEILFKWKDLSPETTYATFDSTSDVCYFWAYEQPLRIVNLGTKEVREREGFELEGLCFSPDMKYATIAGYPDVKVIDFATERVCRSEKRNQKYPGPTAWSPDGKLVAIIWVKDNGWNSKISIHRIGSEVIKAGKAPVPVPERHAVDITDLAQFYISQTDNFAQGWQDFLDDDLLKFHLALVRMGIDSDLPQKIKKHSHKTAAFSHETVISKRLGDEKRAASALEKANSALGEWSIEPWEHTFVYAPLASAQFVMGQTKEADASLELALVELDNEANPFQKRVVFCRALLVMERHDEVRDIIASDQSTWLSQYHRRLFSELVDEAQLDLLKFAFEKWSPDSDAIEFVCWRLLGAGLPDCVVMIEDWLGHSHSDRKISLRAWIDWFDRDAGSAQKAFDKAFSENPDDLVLLEVKCQIRPELAEEYFEKFLGEYETQVDFAVMLFQKNSSLARRAWEQIDELIRVSVMERLASKGQWDILEDFPAEDFEPESHLRWLLCQGRWDEVYKHISETRKTHRNPLYDEVVSAAIDRKDYHIMLDALSRLPCVDCNSRGFRSIQYAFACLAGSNLRSFHP